MKHTKREWMPLYSFLDRKRVTDHLADMAARGWMLDRLGTWSWHYRRTCLLYTSDAADEL